MSDVNEGRGIETGAALARSVLLIVLSGIALGLAFNAIQHRGNTPRALAWIREDRALGSLEDLSGPGAVSPPATAQTAGGVDAPGAAGAPAGVPAAGPTAGTAAAGARDTGPGATAPEDPTATTSGRQAASAAKAGAPASAAPASPAPVDVKQAPAATATAAGLPLIPDLRDPLEVQIATVKKFFDAGAATFVDARSAAEFAEGHITGAVNLSYDEVWQDEARLRAFDPGGRPLIIYCGGGECELSKNLGYALIEAGKKKVLVYMGGIAEWEKAGYPTRKGAGGGAR